MLNNSTLHEFRSPFIEEEVVVLATLLTIVICASIYGNCGLIYVLYQNDKMWTSYYLLIGNLATSGLLISLLSMPFSLATIIIGKWPFEEDAICTGVAFMNSLLLLATIFTHTMISVGKYYAVVKPFSRAMTLSRTKRIIFFIWALAVLMSIGPLFNFGRYSFGTTTLACGIGFPKKKSETGYLFILASVGFVLPNIIMAFVYINVLVSVRKHSKRLGKSSSSSSQSVVSLQKKLVLTALSSLICFLLCWSPFCVFVLMSIFVGSVEKIPHALGISAYWCGFSYNALNPLIIFSMCTRFGDGLRDATAALTRVPLQCVRSLKDVCCACDFKENMELRELSTSSGKGAKYTIDANRDMPGSISSKDLLENP